MIIVQLTGGMGNQMFQYAAGRALALKHGVKLKLDITHFNKKKTWGEHTVFREYNLDLFYIEATIATQQEIDQYTKRMKNNFLNKLLNKILGLKKTYLKQPFFHFYSGIADHGKDIFLEGFWQTEKYFKDYEAIIRKDFTFKKPLSKKAKIFAAQIKNSSAVCVNVRRGDFTITSFHGTMGTDYYDKASRVINDKVDNPHYFIFSDDIEWCSENLRFDGPVTFVDHGYAGEKFSEYLQLMIACKHFVIPNSSFGWWAAWLNTNPGKIVIAPKKWFNEGPKDTYDVIPEEWFSI